MAAHRSAPAFSKVQHAIVDTGRSEVVVISAGAAGAILVDATGARRVAAPVVPIASRVGAGDSMMAGLVLALARAAARLTRP